MNFAFDTPLQYNDPKYGIADISYLLLPENTEETYTLPGQETPELTLSWNGLELDPAYNELIEQVTAVLEGTSKETGDFSVIFNMLAGRDEAKNAGFYVADLDNDGTPELLFGENIEGRDSTVFYDLYTLKDGELVHVFDGWDRSRYYLVNNGGIAHEGSSSAFDGFTALLYYTNGELKLMESIIYNSNADPENPWHLSDTSEYEFGPDDQILTEAEARYTLALYPYITVELDPFLK